MISLPKDIVIDYIKSLEIYPKIFPDIVNVTKINDKDSTKVYLNCKADFNTTNEKQLSYNSLLYYYDKR